MASDIARSLEQYRIKAVAEIHSSSVVGLSSVTTFIASNVITENLRNINDQTKNPIFEGEIEHVQYDRNTNLATIRMGFNKYCDSWNYGWQSNRWNTEAHVVEIILFGHVYDFYSIFNKRSETNNRASLAIAAYIASESNTKDTDEYVVLTSFCSNSFHICCTKDNQTSVCMLDKNVYGHTVSSDNKLLKKKAVVEERLLRQQLRERIWRQSGNCSSGSSGSGGELESCENGAVFDPSAVTNENKANIEMRNVLSGAGNKKYNSDLSDQSNSSNSKANSNNYANLKAASMVIGGLANITEPKAPSVAPTANANAAINAILQASSEIIHSDIGLSDTQKQQLQYLQSLQAQILSMTSNNVAKGNGKGIKSSSTNTTSCSSSIVHSQ